MEIAVLIPAYQPDSVLISLVQALHRENFRLIVTDDGSGPAYADIFSALLPYAEVLTCPENRGKGHALKCALRHLAAGPAGLPRIHHRDADGQHTVADILRVREALLSGAASCSPPGHCAAKASRSARAWATTCRASSFRWRQAAFWRTTSPACAAFPRTACRGSRRSAERNMIMK